MGTHVPVRVVWEFEAAYCRDPKAWLHQALNLRGSLEALLLYDHHVIDFNSDKKGAPPLPAFWSAGVQRMLIGFSLENLAKALILQVPSKAEQAFSKEGNLRWTVSSHDLPKLLTEAGVAIDDRDLTFLELWTTCSTWAGRYPLPMNENELPRRRRPAASSEELLKRRSREIQKALSQGVPLQPEQFDLLHTGASAVEIEVYRNLFGRLQEYLGKPSP